MPKQRDIEYYERKIQKLKKKSRKRRRILTISSESDDNQEVNPIPIPVEQYQEEPALDNPTPAPQDIEPELLLALGEAIDEQPQYGENIHTTLSQRWLPILKNGLGKETKEKLLKDNLIPENCKLLKAPTLNPEIAAAVSEVVRNRDKGLQTKQNQLGIGISAIGKAVTLLLVGDDKLQAVKHLSDGCRILADLHCFDTQTRIKLISPCLEKTFLPIIQDKERDDTLFGNNLPEKIKASKAIEKQGQQIKKPHLQRQYSVPGTTAAPSNRRYQGNWQGPPRYSSSSRGGRGGTLAPASRRRPTTLPPAPSQFSTRIPAFNSTRKRAPTRQ